MRLLGRRLLVRYALRSAFFDESTKNIRVPDEQRKTSNEGIVVVAGPGAWESGVWVPTTVEVGDRVLFSQKVKRSGMVLPVGNQNLRLIDEDDVAALLEGGRHHICPVCTGQGVVTKAIADKGVWAMEGDG